MKSVIILYALVNISLSFTVNTSSKEQKLILHYYNEFGFEEYLINRTVLDTTYIDSIQFPDGSSKVDLFVVKDGKWERYIKGEKKLYFSTLDLIKNGYIYSYYTVDAIEKYKYVLLKKDYSYFGLNVFELDWYYCSVGAENFVGKVYFHENFGPVLYKNSEGKEVKLHSITFVR